MILTHLCLPLDLDIVKWVPNCKLFGDRIVATQDKVSEVGLTRPSSPKNLNWIVALEVYGTYALNPRS